MGHCAGGVGLVGSCQGPVRQSSMGPAALAAPHQVDLIRYGHSFQTSLGLLEWLVLEERRIEVAWRAVMSRSPRRHGVGP